MQEKKRDHPVYGLFSKNTVERAERFVAHMEGKQPASELWRAFIYECGLHAVLGRFISTSPYVGGSPIESIMFAELRVMFTDLAPIEYHHCLMISKAIIRDEDLVNKYFDYNRDVK